jgi:hypothetical protein
MVDVAVCNYLLTKTGVIAIAGARGYVQQFPQSADFPAFRVQAISDITVSHLRGSTNLRPARVQVDAVGADDDGVDGYTVARNLAAAIRAAMMNQPPIVVSVSDGGSPETLTSLEMRVVERLANPPGFGANPLEDQYLVGQDFLLWAKVLP